MTNLERFSTFKPGFSNQNHDLSPITTREDFAKEQLQNSLAQAAFWLGVADEWSAYLDLDYRFPTELGDAMHYTGMAQLRLMD